ncbi:MAG: dihydroneopterin aldolase [Thermoleophilales bacterium]|nr:dihydroneopterin aldolase [Thermoleophilales bacterium]
MSGAERVTIEVRGLETFGPHGVTEEERVAGCRIVLDIALDVEAAATASDEIAETVDYGALTRFAEAFVADRSFHTLERLCAELADEIEAEHAPIALTIRAAKPEPPMSARLTDVAVTLRRGSR